MRFFNKGLTKIEYLERELEKALRKSSHGRIPKEICTSLAKRTISRIDFTNSYQTHKSIAGYADILVQKYFAGE